MKIIGIVGRVYYNKDNQEIIQINDYLRRILSLYDDVIYILILPTGWKLGNSLEDIYVGYNLVEEDILLMRLIKARDYYVDDLYQDGDNELRKVTLSANKTPLVESFIFHILNHKFDYRRMRSAYVRKLVCLDNGN